MPTVAPTPGQSKFLPNRAKSGTSLSFSGGGFRATLFHLGAARRLNELGVLTALDTITSVSGGSFMAAFLAQAMVAVPPVAGQPMKNFDDLARSIHQLTAYDLRRAILRRRLWPPKNWTQQFAELVADEVDERLSKAVLANLPQHPRFVFCATDLVFGVDWVFERARVGDWRLGYAKQASVLETFPIARGIAASSCFPPLFKPIDPGIPLDEYADGNATSLPEARKVQQVRLSDGGVYDNLGLEPVWKDHATVIVSDGGAPFDYSTNDGLVPTLLRYTDVIANQAHALRLRWLISAFTPNSAGTPAAMQGAYWGIGSCRAKYDRADTIGYSEPIARTLIASIRTDLNAFSEGEQAILENHGYWMADVAIRVHLPALYAHAAPLRVPNPDWVDEQKVREALRNSAVRKL